ncbi:Vps51/Vps67-like protein [Cordyceps fumosorosea ARSEF 2679]|uniref:Vacuolar protein sorting-associated protein 51 homolog n=1 Tax=Cordyceps fumosorosea (strain ARSEF 2679) TaxID=1081104 RepID=A0A168EAM8_CORFA|nr:Vps51/Vps67-like protein [Cordyceps fumosorosea ARSEF 2679]OAA73583.1 Vps51/Vps67-like protein [Cordyceps fumosorosea ARSEF 2679]
MSTIASPREPSTPIRRVPSSTITPTSSNRPSLDAARSTVTSPVNNDPPSTTTTIPVAKRANRAALREYYNLRNAAAAPTPRIGVELPDSEVPVSDMDMPAFNTDEYVAKVVAESSLEDLLRLYTRVVGEVRALDAEKKALVYDNYSKLIAATETIRKVRPHLHVPPFPPLLHPPLFRVGLCTNCPKPLQMRSNMDPLNPMASTLNPAIAQIYSQAADIREALRASIPAPDSDEAKERATARRRARTRDLAVHVLATPPRLRQLVAEGRLDEARRQWERPRRLLQTWQERGLGGDEVRALLEEGDAAVAAGSDERVSSDGRISKDERTSRDGRVSNDQRISTS